ncbi:MAG: serine hydrolase [Brevundimonas sp.]|uniref:serine hydrolase n=1 Tax=Brevundimonas sp. TaxID=1871086 RepID=UPI0025B9A3D8|nr:serine hydrolase [Brevundimonas sp.]MBX3476863.1 serine hydrolase [Brevundimonas sp.]
MSNPLVMKSGGGLIAVGLAALMLWAGPAAAQDPERMDQVVRRAVDQGEFTGSVLVVRDGEVLLDRGYGLANREWNIANDGETKFRLASVSKQFTAVAVMLLVQQGQVDLDAPVKTYLTDAPATWDAVTVRHLLNHTSGVPNFTGFDDYQALKTLPTTVDGLIARFRDRPLDFQPGERWSYSNSAYVLATAIIERVSGRTYADFVVENLFRPLDMADSGYDRHETILPRRASGYSPDTDGVVNADYVDMSVPQGAGALYSTTHDLRQWEDGLFGGRLLNAASMAELTRPGLDDYALGLFVKPSGDGQVISHTGGIEGFNTYMGRDTGRAITVVALSNLNSPSVGKLGGDLMTLAQGGDVTLPEERRAVAIAPETLAEYEGDYALAPTFVLTVSVADGQLTVQATGQGRNILGAEGADAFFTQGIDARIVFTRDAAGQVTGLVLHQNGRQMPAPKR